MNDSLYEEIIQETPEEIKRLIDKQVDIAVQLAELIKETGFTQKEFAESIGWKPSYLSRVLAADANLTLKTIAKLEAALGKDLITTPMSFEEGYSESTSYVPSDNSVVFSEVSIEEVQIEPEMGIERRYPSDRSTRGLDYQGWGIAAG